MKKLLVLLVLVFLSTVAEAGQVLQARNCKVWNALVFSADRDSTDTTGYGRAFDLSHYKYASFQVTWASLTGTINGSCKAQVSNDGTNWVDKSGATFNFVGASGTDLISLSAVTEEFYKVVCAHGGISGGTITGYCNAKE